jgi:outer membrane protein OmpA-like peptidoglycan-associated protein
LRIEAHCDSVGSSTYNINLSIRRAFAVKSYLSSKNILPDSVAFSGHGEGKPLNNNSTEEERALNRRAMIVFDWAGATAAAKDTAVIEDTVHYAKDEIEIPMPVMADTLESKSKIFSAKNIEKSREGATLTLDNLNFYGGRHILLPGAEKTLELLLQTLKDYPTLIIEIQGHVCCTPGSSDGFDIQTRTMDLSVQRAKAIYEYLIKNGIDASRLSYKGFGHAHPLMEELTERAEMMNRRVEIKIIKK